jgi:imidazole glycerol phosphate synthase subunit HisF
MILRNGKPWYGRLYSPVVKALVLKTLYEVVSLDLAAPLIAAGGIHTIVDVEECLATGAIAVEIDSAAWVNPQVVAQLAAWANSAGT